MLMRVKFDSSEAWISNSNDCDEDYTLERGNIVFVIETLQDNTSIVLTSRGVYKMYAVLLEPC